MIPAFDYRNELAAMRAEIDAAVARVLDSGRLILGPEVEAFEREFAAFLGAGHAVGVASGTDALVLALRAAGVGRDDEVITVANAGAPPVAAIRAVGAVPRFVDVTDDTLLIDPAAVAAAVSPRTRAILPVHLYGHPSPLAPLLELARDRGLSLIEDCAQAHGARLDGRPVGCFGDAGCFSFYPTKNLGAFGDGGLVVCRDEATARRLRELRMYGFRGDAHAHREGLNSRLDELQAALLRVRLGRLESGNRRRREIAARYLEALEGGALRPQSVAPGCEPVYHLFVVRAPDRAALIAALDRRGIGHGIHYPHPAHLMDAYLPLGGKPGDLPVTEAACRSVVSLPLYPGLDDAAVGRIVAALRDVARTGEA